MNNISNNIYTYCVQHFADLPLDKQIHFASRLYFWDQNPECRQLLDKVRPQLQDGKTAEELVHDLYTDRLFPLASGTRNTMSLREQHFARYPSLRRSAFMLYWAYLLDTVYQLDLRSSLPVVLPPQDLDILYQQLMDDDAAVAALSTYAVNFMYLYKNYILQRPHPDPRHFVRIAQTDGRYDLSDPAQLKLYGYLLSHCIINASGFYAYEVAASERTAYQHMLRQLETALTGRSDGLALDSALEFLVCCRLLDYSSDLEERILQWAEQSISSEGMFLVDTRTGAPSSFSKSEHRTVLYLLATYPRA